MARPGAQLVFTMNLEASMEEFHEVFRGLLAERGLPESAAALAAYIRSRRKPLDEVLGHVSAAGFAVEEVRHDEFTLRYADGSALLRHPFVRVAFLQNWRDTVPADRREAVFTELEARLNAVAAGNPSAGLRLGIPFVTVTARRT